MLEILEKLLTLQTSKAAMLQKGAEYIKQLRGERNKLKEEMDDLRQEIDKLNTAIRYNLFLSFEWQQMLCS